MYLFRSDFSDLLAVPVCGIATLTDEDQSVLRIKQKVPFCQVGSNALPRAGHVNSKPHLGFAAGTLFFGGHDSGGVCTKDSENRSPFAVYQYLHKEAGWGDTESTDFYYLYAYPADMPLVNMGAYGIYIEIPKPINYCNYPNDILPSSKLNVEYYNGDHYRGVKPGTFYIWEIKQDEEKLEFLLWYHPNGVKPGQGTPIDFKSLRL